MSTQCNVGNGKRKAQRQRKRDVEKNATQVEDADLRNTCKWEKLADHLEMFFLIFFFLLNAGLTWAFFLFSFWKNIPYGNS